MQSIRFVISIIALWIGTLASTQAQEIPRPADYFGFEIGSDGEMDRYPRILLYLHLLEDRSFRMDY